MKTKRKSKLKLNINKITILKEIRIVKRNIEIN